MTPDHELLQNQEDIMDGYRWELHGEWVTFPLVRVSFPPWNTIGRHAIRFVLLDTAWEVANWAAPEYVPDSPLVRLRRLLLP